LYENCIPTGHLTQISQSTLILDEFQTHPLRPKPKDQLTSFPKPYSQKRDEF